LTQFHFGAEIAWRILSLADNFDIPAGLAAFMHPALSFIFMAAVKALNGLRKPFPIVVGQCWQPLPLNRVSNTRPPYTKEGMIGAESLLFKEKSGYCKTMSAG
jgi:hypothetical protein